MTRLILCLFVFSLSNLQAQVRLPVAMETELPIFDKERELGDVKVRLEGEKLIGINRDSLLEVLRPHINEDTFQSVLKLPQEIDPTQIPLPLKYNPVDLRLELPLTLEMKAREKLDLMTEYQHRYEKEAVAPAPIGGAINSRMEQSWATKQDQYKYFTSQFDSFVNIKSVVLENQTYYQSNQDKKWFRGDTRLVKDFQSKQIRVQAGDVYPQVQGFMVSRPVGGINISRNFALNPYRLPYPTGTQSFSLNARSFVKYFVNGTLIRSEFLPAGNYTAKDIPLNNGLNTIMIEATDDLGQKKIFVFRSASSINLLNEGESRFDLSYGVPFLDQNFNRNYRYQDGKFLSGFYQFGLTSTFSLMGYGQNQKGFNLGGVEGIRATPVGNFAAGNAQSSTGPLQGSAQSLTYQLIGQGGQSFLSQTLSLRFEHRSEKFRTSPFDLLSAVQNNYSANYTIPVASILTASIGGNYGDVRNNALADRYGYDTTLNLRVLNHHNLSFFLGRNRDEFKQWNNVAYVFLTITFPNSNDFVSTFYDKEQKSSKLTYIRDNQNRLFKPKAQAILENNSQLQSGEVDVLYPTPVAEIGGRVHSDHLIAQDTVIGRGSLRMNSALVFAYQDKELGLGLSRPINNSFVLFKPEPRLRNQQIALKSTSPYTEGQSGLFKEIIFANLLPYQYREVQLDPTMMEEGRSIKKEKYVLFPTYRSAHLITLEERGAVMLRGYLRKPDGSPWVLQVGHVGERTFFTNRDGEFFIEGLEPGNHRIKLDNVEQSLGIQVSDKELGFKNIGVLTIEEDL